MTFYLTKSIGLAAVMTTLITTVPGVSANDGGIPLGHPSYHFFPMAGMLWSRYYPVPAPNYPISGPYPMAQFVNSFHVFPKGGMPWVTGACPNCTTMKSLEPMYPVPVVNRVYEKFPASGMPWHFPQTIEQGYPISGPYPMGGYVNNLPLYPLSGMPWIESMSSL